MKKQKLFVQLAALICATTAWATDYNVGTDSELRTAIQDNNANITVTADIDLSNSTLSIESGKTVTIDLGGYTLDRRLTQRGEGGGQVITVREGATLNISNGTLKGGWGGAGGALVNEGGIVTLANVNITNNVADDRGGGICNREGGTLTMTGGVITDNSSNDRSGAKGGGGLFNEEGATATLTNVTITGNTAKLTGGGGICNFGTLTLNSCTIQNNAANTHGGGIWQEGTLNVQGKNTVTDNWKPGGMRSNLYLKDGTVINITGALADSRVYVDMETLGTFTSGYSAYNDGHPAGFFTADKGAIRGMRLVNGEAQLDNAIPEGGVCYVERSWDETNKRVVAQYRIWESDEYTVLTGREEHYISYDVPGSKILVRGNVTFDGVMELTSKDVAIVLADGACLTSKGVCCARNNFNASITIYAEEGSGTLGKINADAYFSNDLSGIGEYYNSSCSVTIHGGDIYARGGKYASGIGSYTDDDDDNNTDGGDITIYGGKIVAIGAAGGAGIGSGYDVPHYGTIRIYGGTVDAKGATSLPEGIHDWHSSPGIGGGHNCQGGTTHIYGGDITAEGAWEAAGIGCSQTASSAGHIIIDGGHVVARGADNFGAGIGGGDGVSGGTIEINGGEVYAYGGDDAAGIGGGEGASGGTITITGGYVYAEGNDKGAGIGGGQDGAGGNITITGGIVVAKSGGDQRAIGAGYGSDNHGSLTFADNMGVFVTTNLNRSQKANRVIDCRNFAYVRVNRCAHGGATISIVDGEKHAVSGCNYCYAGEEIHTFGDYGECAACGLVSLKDAADNSATIAHWNNTEKAVTLTGRTLYKDGDWNTLCLPFNASLTGVFADATLMELDVEGTYDTDKKTGFDDSDGTLYLYFKNATSIEAGKPYIIKWASGSNITSPAFSEVTINSTMDDVVSADGYFAFVGTYSPHVYTETNKSILFLGSGNSLYYPLSGARVNACRAYFQLCGITAGDILSGVKMYFGDEDDATSIDHSTLTIDHYEEDTWYDLSGRKLSGKPSQKGFYIYNGRKEAVK